MTGPRRRQRWARGERGFTVLEVTITGALLSLALGGFLATLGSTQEVSSFTELRTRALDDMRLAAVVFAKEAREGATAVVGTGPDSITLSTYLGGSITATQVVWSLEVPGGGGAAFDLVRKAGTATATPRGLPGLIVGGGNSRFEFVDATKTARLILVTRPSPKHLPVRLETEVTLRNAAS